MFNHVETETVYVRYIGHKPVKYDTIFGTSTTWTPGAVRRLRVPKGHKIRMLQHRDVWEEVTEQDCSAPDVSQDEPPNPRKELFAKAKLLGLKVPFNTPTDELKRQVEAAHDHHPPGSA